MPVGFDACRRLFVIDGQLTWLVGRGATAPEQTTNSLAFDGDGMRRHRIDHQGSVRGGECLIGLIWLLKCPPHPA